jgi:hypothetical protein
VISLIVSPWTKCSRRIRLIVFTVGIPPRCSLPNQSEQRNSPTVIASWHPQFACKRRKIADVIGCDFDDLLALAGRVSTELSKIIKQSQHRYHMTALLRTAKGFTAEEMGGVCAGVQCGATFHARYRLRVRSLAADSAHRACGAGVHGRHPKPFTISDTKKLADTVTIDIMTPARGTIWVSFFEARARAPRPPP